MSYAIKTEDLWMVYRMGDLEVEALKGVDIEIEEGEFVSVMGPSGSGKSTLMHMMGVLDRPTSGEVWIGGTNVEELSDSVKARFRLERIGFVFQFYSLLSGFTALENVYLPLIQTDIPKEEEAMERSREALETVGLSDRMNHKPKELSGGQRQRVAIARAVANDPDIVLADEATSELDTETSAEIMEMFREISEDGQTVVTVNHEKEQGKKAERTIWLEDGEIEENPSSF
ncbi:MAG: ABC transporter ATP-binding protein [Candidatus Nanohaloarchaea archaeon]